MKQLNVKKLVLLNLPYILLGLFATNFGEAWRLAVGQMLPRNFFPCSLSCPEHCKVSGPVCTRWTWLWACAAALACGWRCI